MAETKKTTKKAPEAPKEALKTPAKTSNSKSGTFAIIETGGKQYRIVDGDVLTIEKLGDDLKVGDKVVFDKVLLIDDGKETKIGTPYIDGAKVEAVFEEAGRGKKVIVMKYKAKSRYLKKNGHRQPFSKVKIAKVV